MKNSLNFAIVLKKIDKIIGYVEINQINQNSKIGCISYWLGEDYWQKGYMSEAIEKVLNYVFNIKRLNKVYAQVNAGNIASQKILEKFGFKLEGRLRKHIYNKHIKKLEDKLFYGLLKSEWKI
jgi:RimJ/RimL family protein N-acetyltransferase